MYLEIVFSSSMANLLKDFQVKTFQLLVSSNFTCSLGDRRETYRCKYGLVGLRVDDRPDRSGNWFSSFCWLPLLFSLVQNDLENDLGLDPKPKLFKNFLPTKYEQKNRKIISTNIYSITTRDITYLSSTSFMFDLR